MGIVAGHPWIVAWIVENRLESAGGAWRGSREVSYERIVWRDVVWSNESMDVAVERLELGLIPRFLNSWFSPEDALESNEPFLSAAGVELTLRQSGKDGEPASDSPATLPEWNRQAADIVETLERWLPPVAIRDVRIHGPLFEASVVSGVWDGMALRLEGASASVSRELPVSARTAAFALNLQRSGAGLGISVRGDVGPLKELVADFRTQSMAERLETTGRMRWEGGDVRGQAVWGASGWAPLTAEAHGTIRELAGTPLDREDLPEAAVVLDFSMAGEDLELALNGEGVWESPGPEMEAIPWKVMIEAAADSNSYRIGRFTVNLPWFSAALESPLTVDRNTLTPEAAAELTWEMDFGALPWLPAQGTGSGGARLAPKNAEGLHLEMFGEAEIASVERVPEIYRDLGHITFELNAEGNRDSGTLNHLRLETTRWGTLSGKGSWNFAAERQVEGQFEATVAAAALGPWMPEWASIDAPVDARVSVFKEADGWGHAGSLREPEAIIHETLPLALEVEWEGTEEALPSWTLRAESAEAALRLSGSATWANAAEGLTIKELEERQRGEVRWTLARPVTFARAAIEDETGWRLDLLELVSAQSDARIEAEGFFGSPDNGQGRLAISKVGTNDLSGWYAIPNDQWFVEQLEVTGELNDGTVTGETRAIARWRIPSGGSWQLQAEARLGAEGLEIVQAVVSSPTARWLAASGFFPLTAGHLEEGRWGVTPHVAEEGRLSLEMRAHEPLPPYFAKWIPIEYENLSLSAELNGALANLTGHLNASGDALAITTENGRLMMEDPELRATFGQGAITLDRFGFRLPGATARARASGSIENIPWETIAGRNFAEVLKEIRVELHTDAFPVAAVAPFLPELVEPSGSVTIDLIKDGEAAVTGVVSWEGMNLKPLPNGAVPRDIQGRARLAGQRLEEIELQASISGRSIRASGNANFEHWPEPLFNLRVEAERIDLVRQLDLILRAKGGFQMVRESLDETPLISGELTLEDSLLLRDLRDFAFQGAAGVSRRPPYFAVEAEPLSSWRLDVNVRGDRFMRVRTPVFAGVVSADFHLQGTLGNPVAIGQATIDEGAVKFPFGKIPLNSGRASISLSDPHTLHLYAQGRGVAFGYDIILQLEGTASDPELTFSSPQGLAQDEIVLMLATGAVPSSDRSSSDATRAGQIALYFGQDIFSSLLGSGNNASKIEIRSGEGFSPYRRSNQVIEYHFNENWSLLGENDDFGDYNVDIKWTVYRE